MSWYFFTMTGKNKWQRHLSDFRQQVLDEQQPEFMTVLEVNHPCDGDTLPETLFYRGDLYFDWDSNDSIADLLDDVKRFMNKLESWGFDLNQASWWLSGKKGVHCTIPMACFFDSKFCQSGVKDLFRIYGRFAWDNSTTYMDMRVYSGRKGRMWRTTCRSRTVGERTTYKTPISPSQLRKLDEEGYWSWCSVKRDAITPDPPTLNTHLATEMQVISNLLAEETKKRSKSRSYTQVFKDWGDEVPPTISAAFNGKNVDMERDLNDLGLQFATAAIALGLNSFDDTDKFLTMCEGFIQARLGQQGVAHKTRTDITERLKKSFHYCIGNPSYTYIPDVFGSILKDSESQNLDLQGIKEGVNEEKLENISLQLQGKLAVDESAIYQDNKEGLNAVADYSWQKGSLKLVRALDGSITHYSVVAVVQGVPQPRRVIPVSTLTNSREFTEYLSGYNATTLLTSPAQLFAMRKALLNFVGDEEGADEISTVKTEGLNCIPISDPEEGEFQAALFWVEAQRTVSSDKNQSDKVPTPTYLDNNNPNGQYGVDLSESYRLTDYASDGEALLSNLLELNGDGYSLAIMLAWFTACTLKHPLYMLRRIKNFPILQIVGQAGCGKTTTAAILLNLFTWRKAFRINLAGRNLTPYAIASLSTASTTIPLVIDEVKPQNLGAQYMADFRGFIQTIYTIGSEAKRGGGDGSTSASYKSISKEPMLAPVCFLAEALEASQASILERSVVAAFHKDATYGRENHARYLNQHERNMGMLGWAIVQELMTYDLTKLVEEHNQAVQEAEQLLAGGNNYRVVENAAMMLLGFDFFRQMVERYYPNKFGAKLTALRDSLAQADRWLVKVSSEIVRMLGLLSIASFDDRDSRYPCIKGEHYDWEAGESANGRIQFLLLSVERCFYLYRERMRAIAMPPAFNSIEEFRFSLANSVMAMDTIQHPVLGLTIKLNSLTMAHEGVKMFKE